MPRNRGTEGPRRFLWCPTERLPHGFAGEFARACDTRARCDQGGSRAWRGGGRQGGQGPRPGRVEGDGEAERDGGFW